MTPFIFVILFWFGHNCWNSFFQKVIGMSGFCVLADPLSMKPSWGLKQASVHARSGCALVSLCLWLTYQEVNDGVSILLQEEELADGLQLEPPGMHMIYLPYADDIRPTEKAGSQLLTQSEIATDWSLQ